MQDQSWRFMIRSVLAYAVGQPAGAAACSDIQTAASACRHCFADVDRYCQVDELGADPGRGLAAGRVAAGRRATGPPAPTRQPRPRRAGHSARESTGDGEADAKTKSRSNPGVASEKVITLAESRPSRRTAEQVMWEHYQAAVAAGRSAPTGAELDKIARTNNYGRAVLRKWQRRGRTRPPSVPTAS
jgi:hypothetical protein